MKHKKIFLAILIIVGSIFAIAFWSNIVKAPAQIINEFTIETFETLPTEPAPLGEYMKG